MRPISPAPATTADGMRGVRSRGVTKQVFQALEPAQAVQATQFAIKHAMSGQKGPVAVLFSFAALNGKVGPDTVPTLYPTQLYMPPPPSAADPALIARAAEALKTAQRPVIIAGNGVRIANAYKELRALSEALGIPVATSAGGKGTFPETHDLALGVYGTFGIATANAVVGNADLVLVVGSKLGASDTARENPELLDPSRQTFIQIDIEPRNASWTFPAEHVLVGDAGDDPDAAARGDRQGRRARQGRHRAGGEAAQGDRLLRSGGLQRVHLADPSAADHRRTAPQSTGGLDRHLRRRREPHPDDASLSDPARGRFHAGRGLRARWALRCPRRSAQNSSIRIARSSPSAATAALRCR